MKKYINYIIVIGFVVFSYFCFLKFYYPENDLPKLYKLPNFNFLMLDGTSYTEKDMEDNISVVNFFLHIMSCYLSNNDVSNEFII